MEAKIIEGELHPVRDFYAKGSCDSSFPERKKHELSLQVFTT
jgi:hypothetical protein